MAKRTPAQKAVLELLDYLGPKTDFDKKDYQAALAAIAGSPALQKYLDHLVFELQKRNLTVPDAQREWILGGVAAYLVLKKDAQMVQAIKSLKQ